MTNKIRKILRIIILRFFETRLCEFLMWNIIPYIRFTFYYTSFRGWRYQRGYKFVKPGRIILTNDSWKFTAFIIPGPWSHATLCVTRDSEFEIAEMTHRHFTRSTFYDLCHESTRVGIFECTDWDEEYVKTVIKTCLTYKDALYGLRKGPKFLSCSKMIVASDPEHRLKASHEDALGLGMSYVSPTDISEALNIRKVWDSDDEVQPCWDDEIQMETV